MKKDDGEDQRAAINDVGLLEKRRKIVIGDEQYACKGCTDEVKEKKYFVIIFQSPYIDNDDNTQQRSQRGKYPQWYRKNQRFGKFKQFHTFLYKANKNRK